MPEIVQGAGADPERIQIDRDTKIQAHQQTPLELVGSARHAAVAASTSNTQPAPANATDQLLFSPILRFVQGDGPWSPETPRTADHQSGISEVMNDCDRLL